MLPQRKISRKTPQNMEEMKWWWKNILVLRVKHGETAPAKKNVPKNATIPGGNCGAVGKHPGFGGKTWRNCLRRRRMSRKAPQFREEIVWRRRNILVLGVIPGEKCTPLKILVTKCNLCYYFLYFCMILTKIRLNYVTYCRLRFYKS